MYYLQRRINGVWTDVVTSGGSPYAFEHEHHALSMLRLTYDADKSSVRVHKKD